MAFPRSGIDSETYNKMVSVWCSEDQNTAFTSATQGRYPATISCDNAVSDQYHMGQRAGVTGTPTIITDHGQLFPGYIPAETLLSQLGITD
jgi:thiol:disulfide interchange protein DsbC